MFHSCRWGSVLIVVLHWVGKITDPDLKRKTEGEIWRSEKEVISKAVGDDPLAALGDLTTGSSPHAEYWIKEAFGQWNTTAPEEAALWYEENRNSLPPSQNQHVARVYAEQAIQEGNLTAANQWLVHVTDEKFKDSLGKMIAQASKTDP